MWRRARRDRGLPVLAPGAVLRQPGKFRRELREPLRRSPRTRALARRRAISTTHSSRRVGRSSTPAGPGTATARGRPSCAPEASRPSGAASGGGPARRGAAASRGQHDRGPRPPQPLPVERGVDPVVRAVFTVSVTSRTPTTTTSSSTASRTQAARNAAGTSGHSASCSSERLAPPSWMPTHGTDASTAVMPASPRPQAAQATRDSSPTRAKGTEPRRPRRRRRACASIGSVRPGRCVSGARTV